MAAVGPWEEWPLGRASQSYLGAEKGYCRAASPQREKTRLGGNDAVGEVKASPFQGGPREAQVSEKKRKDTLFLGSSD